MEGKATPLPECRRVSVSKGRSQPPTRARRCSSGSCSLLWPLFRWSRFTVTVPVRWGHWCPREREKPGQRQLHFAVLQNLFLRAKSLPDVDFLSFCLRKRNRLQGSGFLGCHVLAFAPRASLGCPVPSVSPKQLAEASYDVCHKRQEAGAPSR